MPKEIEFFREEYKKQKKLEKIVTNRVLYRPKIKKWQLTATFAVLPFLLFLIIYFSITCKLNLTWKILLLTFGVIFVFETHLRFCLICVVKYYQRTAKEETRRRCKCIPSCSDYALICLKKIFPLILVALKIKKRLFVTCNGEEYKIDFPTRKMGERFESKL